jgi:integrase/recombinase XerD
LVLSPQATTTMSSQKQKELELFDSKISAVTEGLQPSVSNYFKAIGITNGTILADYVITTRSESNVSDTYRREVIKDLFTLSKFFEHEKSFKYMSRDDLLSYLGSLRKPEPLDPLHKWIGTYNLRLAIFQSFFKWLYHPDTKKNERPKPSILHNICNLKRKEVSVYKPTDLWTAEDDLLFLKYCPSKRIKLYHVLASDSSCRPHELVNLRIKDIVFNVTSDGKQYAEVLVNGKTGNRPIPLFNSVPYLKDWLSNGHPQPSNPNAFLFCGERRSRSFLKPLRPNAVLQIYKYSYRQVIFPKLLKNPTVSPEDKQKIRDLLQKPWNPYIRRHSALTQKSTILKEHVLRQHAGWSGRSQMHLKYLHYFGNESSESLLEAYGIIPKDQQSVDVLRPKQCPNCNEPNKPDSKFCAKCRMVLTYDAYNETLEKQQEKESEVQKLQQKYEQDMRAMRDDMEKKFQQLFSRIDMAKIT